MVYLTTDWCEECGNGSKIVAEHSEGVCKECGRQLSVLRK